MAFRNSILALLLIVFSASSATTILSTVPQAQFVSAASATYIVEENFEQTGAPTSWAVTGTGTTDWDYTTAPAPLQGAQSVRVTTTTQIVRLESTNFAAMSELWVYGMVRPVTFAASTRNFICVENEGGGTGPGIVRNSNGTFEADHGGASATTVGTMAAGTTYHWWIHWKADVAGGSADGQISFAFSTDGVRPTGGNNFCETLVGSSSSTGIRAIAIGIAPDDSNVSQEIIWDKIRVDNVQIGDNPP